MVHKGGRGGGAKKSKKQSTWFVSPSANKVLSKKVVMKDEGNS